MRNIVIFFAILTPITAFAGAPTAEDMSGDGSGSILGWILLIAVAIVLYLAALPLFFFAIAYKFRHQRRLVPDYFARCFRVAKTNVPMFMVMSPFLIILTMIPLAIIVNLPLLVMGIDHPEWLLVCIPIGLLLAAVAAIKQSTFDPT